jgi:hypothetical protein
LEGIFFAFSGAVLMGCTQFRPTAIGNTTIHLNENGDENEVGAQKNEAFSPGQPHPGWGKHQNKQEQSKVEHP